ncbi:MAG: isoprenyl transferase [Bacteroidales bacterium]|nr:isoprenyl transferase [Bacteroidales bacterium]
MSLKDKLDIDKLPRHVAIIMDGNGRWARKKRVARVFGHKYGVTPVREMVEASGELGIEYLTLYAFSTENWGRSVDEVKALMGLLVSTIKKETKKLNENNVRFSTIGDLDQLPKVTRDEIFHLVNKTKNNTGLNLVLALSYSARWEILHAVRSLMAEARDGKMTPEQLDHEKFRNYLETGDIPDPELLIRTSGEYRISNFLLYQIAYSELFFTDKLWPDFRKEDYYAALLDFQSRERRFGKTDEQL